jgi:hypothetical protein
LWGVARRPVPSVVLTMGIRPSSPRLVSLEDAEALK